MRLPTVRSLTAALALLAAGLVIAPPALAQQPATVPPSLHRVGGAPAGTVSEMAADVDAGRTRDQFMDLLNKYPPALGRVLKLDSSLLANQDYLAPYPALQAFLAQHPEVQRDPSYYLSRVSDDSYESRSVNPTYQSYQMWEEFMGGLAGITVAIIILSTLGWLLRLVVDYRRWHRLSKVQAEVHNKLLDRMTSNDELVAYVQSPAGSRFLQSAPISLDPGGRPMSAPLGRILWSIQAGLVLAAGGLGLEWVSGRIMPQAAQPLYTLGVLALALGIGFVLSAGVSYALSRRLGLFDSSAHKSSSADV